MTRKRSIVLSILLLSAGAAFSGTLWSTRGTILQGQLSPGASVVIDDGDGNPSFATTGQGWQRFQHSLGYRGGFLSPASVTAQDLSATWTFSGITAGQYRAYVTFKGYSLLSNQVPYVIKDGAKTIGTVTVNQRVDPSGNLYDGRNWQLLGTFTVAGNALSVSLMRPANLTVNGVIADAARIEFVSATTARTTTAAGFVASSTPRTSGVTSSSWNIPSGGSNYAAGRISGGSPSVGYPTGGYSSAAGYPSTAYEGSCNPQYDLLEHCVSATDIAGCVDQGGSTGRNGKWVTVSCTLINPLYVCFTYPVGGSACGFFPNPGSSAGSRGGGGSSGGGASSRSAGSQGSSGGGGGGSLPGTGGGGCPIGSTICPPCNPPMTVLECNQMRCMINGKVFDPQLFQCVCRPGTGCSGNSQDPYCSCLPLTCPPGSHLNPETNTCIPDSVCGDGYLEQNNTPRELCETNPKDQGCPPGRTCAACKECHLCGNSVLQGNEACEADYACGSGKACDACRCVNSVTPLTANVTTIADDLSRLVTKTVLSPDRTRTSWNFPVAGGDQYDIYVRVNKILNGTSVCPISYWRVYNGSQEVRPLLIAYGSPLCQTWPGGSKDWTWIRIAQVPANSASIRVEHEPSPTPTAAYAQGLSNFSAPPTSVKITKVIAGTETPAPLGVTLIDDGDQGFSVSGPYETTDGSPHLPWFTKDQGQINYGDDYVSAPYYPSWAFTVTPDSSYKIFVSFRAPNQTGGNYDKTYSIVDGWNNALPPTPRGQELGPVTIDGSVPPDGPWFRGVQWEELGTFTVKTNRLTITDKHGFFGSDAIRIERTGGQTSSHSSAVSSIGDVIGYKCTQGTCQQCFVSMGNGCTEITLAQCQASCGGSSASSASSQASQCAQEGEVLSENDMRQCCADMNPWYNLQPNASGQCPSVSLTMICIRQCGDGACTLGENECNCEIDCPRSLSSASSAQQSSVIITASCIAEGQQGDSTKSPPDQCCAGLNASAIVAPTSTNECVRATSTRFVCIQCDPTDNRCGPGENWCNCPTDCAGPSCTDSDGGRVLETPGTVTIGRNLTFSDRCFSTEQSNTLIGEYYCKPDRTLGLAIVNCPQGGRCTGSPAACALPPPSTVAWSTVGSSYYVSTVSDYALFTEGRYLYLVGGMGFWGPVDTEARSQDGLQWLSAARLPQPLSNAAAFQSSASDAYLLGGLNTSNSVVNWAFVTQDLLSVGFRSDPTLALPASRYDAAAFRIADRTYLLGGTIKTSSLGGSLLGSLLASLIGQQAVPRASYDTFVHNGTSWQKLSTTLPIIVTGQNAFTINGRLFLFDQSSDARSLYQSQDGTAWTQAGALPAVPAGTRFLKPFIHKGAVWLIGKNGDFAGSALVSLDGTSWQTVTGAFPSDLRGFVPDSAISYKGEITLLGTVSDLYTSVQSRNGKVLTTGVGGGPTCRNGRLEPGEDCERGIVNIVNPCRDGQQCNFDSCLCPPFLFSSSSSSSASSAACTDSDGGKNYTQVGTITNYLAYGTTVLPSATDVCFKDNNHNPAIDPNVLLEGFCGSDGYGHLEQFTCPNGCQNGVCLPPSSSASSASSVISLTCGNGRLEAEECDSTAETLVNPCGPAGICGRNCLCCREPAPPVCSNGILIPQLGLDANGCKRPPACCAGAIAPQAQCSIYLTCGNGACSITSCTCT